MNQLNSENVVRVYNHKKDSPDPRDYKLPDRKSDLHALSKMVDLRPICPPVYDQGTTSSCSAQATAAMLAIVKMKDEKSFLDPSRMFIYYNARYLHGNSDQATTCSFRDVLSTIQDMGVCPESDWKFETSLLLVKPTDECYKVALNNKFQYYAYIDQNENALKHCLDQGYPFVFALNIYWYGAIFPLSETGVLNMPLPGVSKPESLGLHALCCVGYDDEKRLFLIRNSFGPTFGIDGYFYLHYEFMLDPDCTGEFWTLRTSSSWETEEYH